MKTDELIHLLPTDDRPVQPSAIERRFAVASAVGIAGAGVLMLALFGLRPDLLATGGGIQHTQGSMKHHRPTAHGGQHGVGVFYRVGLAKLLTIQQGHLVRTNHQSIREAADQGLGFEHGKAVGGVGGGFACQRGFVANRGNGLKRHTQPRQNFTAIRRSRSKN